MFESRKRARDEDDDIEWEPQLHNHKVNTTHRSPEAETATLIISLRDLDLYLSALLQTPSTSVLSRNHLEHSLHHSSHLP